MRRVIFLLCGIFAVCSHADNSSGDKHGALQVKSLDNSIESTQVVLHVRGSVQLKVAPNQVTIVLGVTSQHKTATGALSDNSQLMNKVIAALYKKGLKKEDVNTQRFGVQPIWSSRPQNSLGGEEWRSSITSYRVNNALRVVTAQLNKSGEIVSAATKAGANQVQSISFGLSNPREYRKQAITAAINNAKEDAEFAAAASELVLDGIKAIHLDNSVPTAERAVTRSALSSAVRPPLELPIKPENITLRASVSVEYLLSEK